MSEKNDDLEILIEDDKPVEKPEIEIKVEKLHLTVDGRPVTLERPAWFLEALGMEAA